MADAGTTTALVVRRATDADLEAVARITSIVTPENPTTVEELRWADATYPGGVRFLAELDGLAIGAANVGRVFAKPPEFEGFWASLAVLAHARRRGAGSALLAAVSDHAREQGKAMLMGRTSAAHPDALEFLAHRGFREANRMRVVRLTLDGLRPPEVAPPAGIEVTSLEERPDLVRGVYEVALEALPDIPGEGAPVAGPFEEFVTRDVARPGLPPGGFVVAVDVRSAQVVGYASIFIVPGQPKLGWHHMTGVARAWRGRGLASAMKRATIRWAIGAGLEALEGANDVDNAAMRAINRTLGYEPEPDEIEIRGPLWSPPIMAR